MRSWCLGQFTFSGLPSIAISAQVHWLGDSSLYNTPCDCCDQFILPSNYHDQPTLGNSSACPASSFKSVHGRLYWYYPPCCPARAWGRLCCDQTCHSPHLWSALRLLHGHCLCHLYLCQLVLHSQSQPLHLCSSHYTRFGVCYILLV